MLPCLQLLDPPAESADAFADSALASIFAPVPAAADSASPPSHVLHVASHGLVHRDLSCTAPNGCWLYCSPWHA